MQSVTVLTIHGRRQVVKVEPSKTVEWVNLAKCDVFACHQHVILICLRFL